MKKDLSIREFQNKDVEWAKSLLTERWKSPEIVTRGKKYNALLLPGFVAMHKGKPAGLITYRVDDGEYEIITLDAIEQGRGIGSELINSIIDKAKSKYLKRVWLITTNDNLRAQEFYKNNGFSTVAVYKDAVDESRKLKPEIPLLGENGIPIIDEIEMEVRL